MFCANDFPISELNMENWSGAIMTCAFRFSTSTGITWTTATS